MHAGACTQAHARRRMHAGTRGGRGGERRLGHAHPLSQLVGGVEHDSRPHHHLAVFAAVGVEAIDRRLLVRREEGVVPVAEQREGRRLAWRAADLSRAVPCADGRLGRAEVFGHLPRLRLRRQLRKVDHVAVAADVREVAVGDLVRHLAPPVVHRVGGRQGDVGAALLGGALDGVTGVRELLVASVVGCPVGERVDVALGLLHVAPARAANGEARAEGVDAVDRGGAHARPLRVDRADHVNVA